MEEDGFEMLDGPPRFGSALTPTALAAGALVLELAGERKRTSAVEASRDQPRLLAFLSRSDSSTVWRTFDVDLADEQITLPWRTIRRRHDDDNDVAPIPLKRSAGNGTAALWALFVLIAQGKAEAEWTMEEESETAQRTTRYLLVIRVSIYAEEDGEAVARLAVKRESGQVSLASRRALARSETKDAIQNRKDLLYALRTDDAASKKQGFSMAAAVQAAPRWLLHDSDADAKFTLRELYNAIPSPPREPWRNVSERWQTLVKSLVRDDAPPGIRTKMFNYQRHTVAQLLVRELNAGVDPICDPRLIECTSLNGARFYVDGSNFTISRRRRALPDCSGSILSEHMGLGKTLECIALILSTRKQRAMLDPPGEVIDETPDNESDSDDEVQEAPPPFSFLCRPRPLHRPRANHRAPRVAMQQVQPLRIFRSYANVVCVPIELLRQWTDQLEEHLAVPPEITILGKESRKSHNRYDDDLLDVGGATGNGDDDEEEDELGIRSGNIDQVRRDGERGLRVLILRGNTGEIPPAAELATYDIILLTIRRLQAEWKRCGGLMLRYRGNKEEDAPVSPLMQCQFRRIIVDEGHVLASTTSNLVSMAKAMKCQSRLLVSGTPTANLVGTAHEDIGMGLPSSSSSQHKWTGAEARDLERVGRLMENFFLHPTFQPKSNHAAVDDDDGKRLAQRDWNRDVMAPLNIKSEIVAPDVGAVQRLRKIFARIFVRSGNEAKEEVNLPRCNAQVVELRMNSAERVTYNAIQALIALNNLSGAKGFHEKGNEKYRAQVIENIKLATFWFHSPETPELVEDALKRPEALYRPMQKEIDEQEAAFRQLRLAITEVDENGRPGGTLRYFSAATDPSIASWTAVKPVNDALPKNFTPEAIISVRRALDEVQYAGQGFGPEATLRSLRHYYDTMINTAFNGSGSEEDYDELFDPSPGVADPNKPVMPRYKMAKKKRNDRAVDYARITADRYVPPPVAKTQLQATSSTKLSWVINYVRRIPADEKVAIFSSMHNIRLAVANAFEVAQIEYAMHCPEVHKDEHGPALDRFRDKPIVRAVIMDFTTGGRGHNIQCASHCLLLEPVWNLDQELQAIKRFHRLGQKREVHVTTLVMRGSFEQEIMARRKTIKRQQADGSITTYMSGVSTSVGGRQTDILSDPTMRDFLSRARYVELEPDVEEEGTQRLPFTRLVHPMYPFAHYHPTTGQLMLEADDEDEEEPGGVRNSVVAPARRRVARALPASLANARIQNRAAIEAASAQPAVRVLPAERAQPSGNANANANRIGDGPANEARAVIELRDAIEVARAHQDQNQSQGRKPGRTGENGKNKGKSKGNKNNSPGAVAVAVARRSSAGVKRENSSLKEEEQQSPVPSPSKPGPSKKRARFA
ncbi:unnamed protein product [Tilletia caries]|nr:unnamed protein product [Tilletia caries]